MTANPQGNDLLTVRGLEIRFAGAGGQPAVDGVDFRVAPGETLGIVGESGSGKTISCLSLLGLLPPGGRVSAGSAVFDDVDLLSLGERDYRRIRGRRIGMVFQDPMTALNPFLPIGKQVMEPMRYHLGLSRADARRRTVALLGESGIQDPGARFGQYPHEFSGGMRQRVMIAMALAAEPELLIADEPTSALDVTVQDRILSLLEKLLADRGIGMLFVSHDLRLVRRMAGRVLVMENGCAVEQGETGRVFDRPEHPYTRKLLQALPGGAKPEARRYRREHEPPLLKVDRLSVTFSLGGKPMQAVDSVCLEISPGEVLGLVGESGSGKTTLSRAVLRIGAPSEGEVWLRDIPWHRLDGRALRRQRRMVQMVFQDPYSSLDPRMTIHDSIAEPIRLHGIAANSREVTERVLELLGEVDLSAAWAYRYPHEFSGGQRQRVAIARALAAGPDLLVADEPVSALDVTVQRRILDLLVRLVSERGVAMLFVTHDLGVVRRVADRVAVMHGGRIVECDRTETVFRSPRSAHARELLRAGGAAESAWMSDHGQG
jgi:ABC-type glutathione transport system ATPase component